MLNSHGSKFAQQYKSTLGAIAANAPTQDCADGTLTQDFWLLHEAGWLEACLPVAMGGRGWGCEWDGLTDAIEALRLLGYANLSTARLFEGHMNAVKLIAMYGTQELVERIVQKVANGSVLGVWGANRPQQAVSLTSPEKSYFLRGSKQFASGLGLVSYAIISAEAPESDGTQLLIIPVDDPDRQDKTVWQMAGMQATQSGHYTFNGVRVSDENLVGHIDDYYREPFFEGGVWRYCAAHIGGAEAIYDAWRAYLIDRGRAGDTIQRSRILEAAKALGTANLWIERAARSVERTGAEAGSMTTALLARDATEEACLEVLILAEKAMGMAAHVRGSLVERMRRDLRLYLCQAAPDAKRERIASALLDANQA